MSISVILRERCAVNWNYGRWAILILFCFIFIEGVDRAGFDFLCQYQVLDWIIFLVPLFISP